MKQPEIGSFFALTAGSTGDEAPSAPDPVSEVPQGWQLLNSGRAALSAILQAETAMRCAKTIWIPSYYCHDVVDYVAKRIQTRSYRATPLANDLPIEVGTDDLVLAVSYFGMEPTRSRLAPHQVILDVTHDPFAPWIAGYPAGWVFGSLRKTLPLPEGAFARPMGDSQMQLDCPAPSDAMREEVQAAMTAMRAKARWLANDGDISENERKNWYRSLRHHEAAFATLQPSKLSDLTAHMLHSMPIAAWRDRRLENLRFLNDLLLGTPSIQPLESTYGMAILMSTIHGAKALRSHLVEQQIFPAKIWPQFRFDKHEFDIAERILLIHTDHRYDHDDMHRIAGALQAALTAM